MLAAELLQGTGLAAIIVYLFVGISVLCDEHLCPVLERLCTQFKLPTALAGATLLAFGSSAPEIIIGACGAASDQTELSIPTILVSALIAFGAIPPMVVHAAGEITLDGAAVFRDAIAYGLSLGLLLYFDQRKEIGPYRAATLTVAYLAYLLLIWRTSPTAEEEAEQENAKCVAALEEAAQPNSDALTNGDGPNGNGWKVSSWLSGLTEKDIMQLNNREKLAEPLLTAATIQDEKNGQKANLQGKIMACSPINGGASPTISTACPTPSATPLSVSEGTITPKFINTYSVGKCYEVESLVTMRSGQELHTEIKREFKEGTIVKILELTTGRRAKVAVGSIEGWVSLVTVNGETLIGKTEVGEEVSTKEMSEEVDTTNSNSEEDEPETFCGQLQGALSRPFTALFERTIPENPSSAFAMCLVYLCVLSEASLFFAGVLSDAWHISGATAGMTLLAFGGQIPDAIAAVELARNGMPDAAVAQAVASQVINITLGVGLPFFIYTCITGRPTVNNHPKEIFTIAASLAVVIAAYLVVLSLGRSQGFKITITRCRAAALMIAFGACYLFAILAVELGR